MTANRMDTSLWKADSAKSVDMYNDWFMTFAPSAYKESRMKTAGEVETALIETRSLTDISPDVLKTHPEVLPILRMSTCPPLARDRLIGLADVQKSLVQDMEDENNPHIPAKMKKDKLDTSLQKITNIITKMIDKDLFPWLSEQREPQKSELERSSTVVADRLCGNVTNPIIRNAQEKRQISAIVNYLQKKGYIQAENGTKYNEMEAGSFLFHVDIPAKISEDSDKKVNISVDVAVMLSSAKPGDLPLLLELKSAGDFTNVNKRRKEEATKHEQLKNTYKDAVSYCLFLCGYFDTGYLGYEAAEGIDWVWEHRIEDLDLLGI